MASKLNTLSRRTFIAVAATGLAAPALAQVAPPTVRDNGTLTDNPNDVFRNMAGFRAHHWQDYFDNTKNGVILVDTYSRALQYWSEDLSMTRIYPTSIPLSEDLTRRGRTEITRKVVGPSWSPTPSMRQRNPEWPDFIGPGPDNPLGTHALHLSWQYYRIHGTHDTRKIGRQSSNGCIGLYNEDIAELYELANVGTQVVLI